MKFYHYMMAAAIMLLSSSIYALETVTPKTEILNDTDANIIGHVIEKGTNEHMPYVNIFLKGTTIGTTTDDSGHYMLTNLPEGKYILEAATMGYKTESVTVEIKKGKTLEINFQLEEDAISLNDVVVSANRHETSRRMAPTLVNVLSLKTFETTSSCDLSQGLKFQPGIRVENNCQNCGFNQVRINGLDGPYTQILIDSRPIFSALAGVYGLEQVPANMVDRVEVMRGGGSALFGGSAIAGTINIITREPLRNSVEASHTITNYDGSSTFENNTTLNATLVSDDRKIGAAIFGQNRERSGFDYDGDGFTELPMLKNQTIGIRSYIKTGLYSKITAEYHHMSEFRRGGDQLSRPPHETNITEQTQHYINTGSLKYDNFSPDEKQHLSVFASAQHVKRDSYYGGGQDLNAYGRTTDLTWLAGFQYSYNFDKLLFMPSTVTTGAEYNQDNIDDNMWGYNRNILQEARIASAFLQNEWKNDKWSFLLGGRLDKHNMVKNTIFSPRANIRFNPNEHINLRASYSVGFRAPQAFDEDLHIANVGGTVLMIQLSDNLKEEKSHSFNLSADMYEQWGDWQANLLIEGFYTKLKDVFALEDKGLDEQGYLIYERCNEDQANVYGVTVEGKISWKNKWQCQAGFTLQKSEYNEARSWSEDASVPKEKRLFRSPNQYGYFTMTYNPIKSLGIALSGTYTGSMLVEHHAGYIEKDETVKTKDFMELNLKLTYDFKVYDIINLQLNAGVKNITQAYQNDFDKGSDRDSGYIFGPGTPRSYFAGIKMSF